MSVTLLVPIAIAVVILLHLLRAVETEVKKSARDDDQTNHER